MFFNKFIFHFFFIYLCFQETILNTSCDAQTRWYTIYLLCLPHQRGWGFQKLLQLIQHSFRIVVSQLVVYHTIHSNYQLFLTVPSPEFGKKLTSLMHCSCPSLISFWIIADTWNTYTDTTTLSFGMFHKVLFNSFINSTSVSRNKWSGNTKSSSFRSPSSPGWVWSRL